MIKFFTEDYQWTAETVQAVTCDVQGKIFIQTNIRNTRHICIGISDMSVPCTITEC